MNKPKVEQISETLFEVLGYSVKLQTRHGRTLLLCDCTNHTKFCKENPFCYHKQLVLEYINLKPIKKALQEMINYWELQVGIKTPKAEQFLDELNKLKKIIEGKRV